MFYFALVGPHIAALNLSPGPQGRSWSHATIIGHCSQLVYLGTTEEGPKAEDPVELEKGQGGA